MTPRTPAYDALVAHHARIYRLEHVASIVSWDRATMMPPGGAAARGAASAELEAVVHGLRTDARVAAWLDAAESESLDELAAADVREWRHAMRRAAALPGELVERLSLATARCEHAWRTQRAANDWPGFLANWREVLALVREQGARLGDALGLSPYDALIDGYEPGMTTAELDALFGDVQAWLPDLVTRAIARQAGEPAPVEPVGPFPIAAQRALSLEVMRSLGFDFTAGRLDESAHPFSGGVPEDVRITTRYREHDLVSTLMSTIHETGHARYEQGRPRDRLGRPSGNARSMGLHESQSLSFEMQLARRPAFARWLSPLLAAHLGPQPAFEAGNLTRLLTQVSRSRIRVEADELTYPLHVILRYGLEKALIAGDAGADDVPALWDAGMQRLLGVDTRGDARDGCLQDVHWSEALVGYFPCYTLGAMYAAQWFATLEAEAPDLDAQVERGDFAPVSTFMRERVWEPASRWPTDELVRHGTGSRLSAAHFRRHLERRYLGAT